MTFTIELPVAAQARLEAEAARREITLDGGRSRVELLYGQRCLEQPEVLRSSAVGHP